MVKQVYYLSSTTTVRGSNVFILELSVHLDFRIALLLDMHESVAE